ncbi:MAG: NAD(P)-dependent alcohol dehydrogenase [Polaromonas sp.]|uniref:NAD(P)-dependent alcohol dehydrogenase n=1 Tax=Polaromonas sp. TaxID=1869339 RepID=UPI002732904C|nr:NAD(P)-dependent alcohol dehydrogenase [Polaromonas sp.]MDP2817392.1 NAD(P)-dependent alcohol dehydrogenase [Polaromonas sp.]
MTTLEEAGTVVSADGLMTALVCERYGTPDVLKFVEIPRPTPKNNEILIRVLASTITSGDLRVRSMDMPEGFRTLGRLALGWHVPRNATLGATFAGVVQSVGNRAAGFTPGNEVFGIRGFRMGGHAEYLCMSAKGAIAHKPEHLSFEGAAALSFGGGTALFFLTRAGLVAGETILVNGASGNVGMAAVQLACVMGGQVTGIGSAAHLDQVRSLGAVRVINYALEDFTALEQRYDVVFDVACNQSVERCLKVLNPGGRLIRLQAGLPEMCRAMLQPRRAGRHIIVGTAEERADQLGHLAELVRQGRYRPVIARVFPFEEAIEAHRYADRPGHGGSVVLKMSPIG